MKHIISLLMLLTYLTASAEELEYTYEGTTLIYTITGEGSCRLKAGYIEPNNGRHVPGNDVSGNIIIPSEIKNGRYAYKVTGIGNSAFWYCNDLISVTIPNSVEVIGESAFQNCSGLASAIIQNGVTSIEKNAFLDCSSLTSVTIPNSVKSIGNSAFKNCSSLTYITIPNSVTQIGENAFEECYDLDAIYIDDIAAWCNIKFESSYSNPCSNTVGSDLYLNGVKITDLVIPNGVTSIGDYAFNCCNSLTSVTIPNSVTSIGVMGFANCNKLKSVYINDIAAWCNIKFKCRYIGHPLYHAKYLYLNGVKVIDLVIPNGVTAIGKYAFNGYSSLQSVTIPKSVTSIGVNSFSDTGLTSVYIDDIAAWCNIEFDGYSPLCHANNLYINGVKVTDIVIPDGVTSIGGYAFKGCSILTSVTIPNSVTSIGEWAFRYCRGLTSINIPNRVTYIGRGAFDNCSGLTSITIPVGVTSIGDYTFSDCNNLKEIISMPHKAPKLSSSAFDDSAYKEALLVYDLGEDVDASYADTNNEWWHFENYEQRDLSENKSIKYQYNTDGTATIIGYYSGIPADIELPNRALYQGRIYKVTAIADDAFAGCEKLTSVKISNSITTIGSNAFSGCTNLASIEIPNSVTTIMEGAFSKCSSLKSIEIPNSLTSIEKNLFYYCSSLETVKLPNTITYIGYGAFFYCRNLASIVLPSSVTTIASMAFAECNKLTTIYSANPIPPSHDKELAPQRPFYYRKNATLYVPKDAVEAYKAADIWKYFNNIQGYDFSTGITDVETEGDEKENTYYDISGRRLAKPQKGLNIVNGKKVIIK